MKTDQRKAAVGERQEACTYQEACLLARAYAQTGNWDWRIMEEEEDTVTVDLTPS